MFFSISKKTEWLIISFFCFCRLESTKITETRYRLEFRNQGIPFSIGNLRVRAYVAQGKATSLALSVDANNASDEDYLRIHFLKFYTLQAVAVHEMCGCKRQVFRTSSNGSRHVDNVLLRLYQVVSLQMLLCFFSLTRWSTLSNARRRTWKRWRRMSRLWKRRSARNKKSKAFADFCRE